MRDEVLAGSVEVADTGLVRLPILYQLGAAVFRRQKNARQDLGLRQTMKQ
jgi:hypothetical protein